MKRWTTGVAAACCALAASATASEIPLLEEGDLTEPNTPEEDPPASPTPTQVTLVDAERYQHRSWYTFWDFPWQPTDWTTPVDYSRGVTYFRFDITELLEPAMLQFCYFQDRHVSEKHACGPQWTFTQPGIYYRYIDNRALWQRHVIDWSRELLDFMLIDNLSEGRARTNVEVSIMLVGAGAALEPPEGWECPPEWRCAGDEPPTTPSDDLPESIPEAPSPQDPVPPPQDPDRPPARPPSSEPSDAPPTTPEGRPESENQPLTALRSEGAQCAWRPSPSRSGSPGGALTLGSLVALGAAIRRSPPKSHAESGLK